MSNNSATPPPTDRIPLFPPQKKRRDWLLRKQSLLRLTPFPSLAAGLLAQSSKGFERSQQSRGDRSGAVAIVGCWLWLIMAENLFSKTIIRLRHRFAVANNSRTQTSHPRRHRLTESLSFRHKKKEGLATTQAELAPLNAVPFARRGAPCTEQ